MSLVEFMPLLAQIGIYALLAMSLNQISGMTGLLQLGHAGFFAVGAYAAGLVAIYATVPALGMGNLLIGAGGAVGVALLFALAIGLPCLRLRGDYFAIATLGFGEIVRLLLTNLEFPGCAMTGGESFGGPTGIAFTEIPGDLWPQFPDYSAQYAGPGLIWLCVGLVYLLLRNLKFSAFGRALMCIREDEVAARAMGINVPGCKTRAFLHSAALAGFAGALFFHLQLRVSPTNFSLLWSITFLLMVVLGGMGSFAGALCGAVLLGFMPMLLRHVSVAGKPLGEYNQLLYAALLIVLIRLAPNGLFGMHEWPAWLRRPRYRRVAAVGPQSVIGDR
jgi:branched-chain amino acid transport system permease protein